MTKKNSADWWERERQQFLKRILVCLMLVLALIGYFTYINRIGRTGIIDGISFPTANYIAFVRREDNGNSVLYAVRADGSDLRRLTTGNDAANKEHPVWTPDGRNLIFASNMKDLQTTQLYILGSGGPVQITYGAGNKFSPTVSPNGKLVAFITQGVVKTVTITGTDVTQIMPLPRAGNESETGGVIPDADIGPYLSAAFAADGQTISGIQDISNALIQARSDDEPGSKPDQSPPTALPVDQQVLVLPGSANKPYPAVAQGHEVSMAWEPGGSRLACTYTELPMLDNKGNPVDTDGNPLPKSAPTLPISGIQIWTFGGDSKPVHQPLYACLGYSVEPKNIAWSPEGGRLAFEMWLLKSEGVRQLAGIRILDIVEAGKDPNGNDRYQGYKNLPQDVPNLSYLVAASAEGKPQNPRWSPDGKRLCYEMLRTNGKRDLWIVNADGTNQINLTKGHGDNSEAAWAPVQ